MVEFKTGGLAKSLAGHDKGQLYIIIGVSGEYVTLSDGRKRPSDRPKRKNKKHLQLIHVYDENLGTKMESGVSVRDEEIRSFIKAHQQ